MAREKEEIELAEALAQGHALNPPEDGTFSGAFPSFTAPLEGKLVS